MEGDTYSRVGESDELTYKDRATDCILANGIISNEKCVLYVFALAYLTTVFLWPVLLFFHCFVSHEREGVPLGEHKRVL